jgi:hypothetical protein
LGWYKLFDIAWTCILFPLGGIYTYLYARKKYKKNNIPRTIIGNIIGTMGWVVSINLATLGFLFKNKFGEALAPVFLILWALFFILTGISIKFKPIIIGGILLNLMGYAAFYISGQYHGLILAAGAVIGMIIPGILLNRANRNEHV